MSSSIDGILEDDSPGARAVVVADLRDEIELERRTSKRLLRGPLWFGMPMTVFFLSFVVSGVGAGAPAVILTVASGFITLIGAARYQRSKKRSKRLEVRLASVFDAIGSSEESGEDLPVPE